MRFQKLCVSLKELNNKSFKRNEVHIGIRVKKLKVDLDEVPLNKFQPGKRENQSERPSPSLFRYLPRPLPCSVALAWLHPTGA